MYYVSLQPFLHSQNTLHLFKLMQFFMMNFYLEIDDRHSSTSKMMKGYLRVDAELHQKKVRGLINRVVSINSKKLIVKFFVFHLHEIVFLVIYLPSTGYQS